MIRKAILNDAEIITKFNYLLALETEGIKLDIARLSKGVIEILSDPSKGVYYVFEKDGKLIGQLMITKEYSDWRRANFAWIQSVYVDKAYRKQNVFQSLFNYILNKVKTDPNYCGLRLYVDKNNTIAKNIYERLGMRNSNYLMFEFENKTES